MLPNSWGWGGVGCDHICCTWTRGWFYATVGFGMGWYVLTFVALEHMVDATQQLGLGRGGMWSHLLHLNTWLILRNSWVWDGVICVNIRCTWTHGWCYATVGFGMGWDVITFVALEHMVDATQQLSFAWRWNNKPNLLEALANLAKKTNNRAVWGRKIRSSAWNFGFGSPLTLRIANLGLRPLQIIAFFADAEILEDVDSCTVTVFSQITMVVKSLRVVNTAVPLFMFWSSRSMICIFNSFRNTSQAKVRIKL